LQQQQQVMLQQPQQVILQQQQQVMLQQPQQIILQQPQQAPMEETDVEMALFPDVVLSTAPDAPLLAEKLKSCKQPSLKAKRNSRAGEMAWGQEEILCPCGQEFFLKCKEHKNDFSLCSSEDAITGHTKTKRMPKRTALAKTSHWYYLQCNECGNAFQAMDTKSHQRTRHWKTHVECMKTRRIRSMRRASTAAAALCTMKDVQ
jgi:hypothetical protein